MPVNYIKSLVKKGKGTKKSLEKKWREAEKQAQKQGQGDNYAYRTAIFKKMAGVAGYDTGEIAKFLVDEVKMTALNRVKTIARLANTSATNSPKEFGDEYPHRVYAEYGGSTEDPIKAFKLSKEGSLNKGDTTYTFFSGGDIGLMQVESEGYTYWIFGAKTLDRAKEILSHLKVKGYKRASMHKRPL